MRRNSNTTSRPQTWGPTSTSTRKRRRRKRPPPKQQRQRKQLLFCVAIFVLLWLWFIIMIISWISQASVTTSNGGLRKRPTDTGNQLDTTNDNNDGQDSLKNDLASDRQHHRDFRIPTFQRFTENAPTCDKISEKDVNFTLVTQLSSDRLWMMKYHCERWNGLISVAILTNRTFDDLQEELSKMECNTEQLTLQVLSSDLYPSDEYPVNVLRNMALSRVTTSHVMYVDVDFWESQSLHLSLNHPQVRTHLAQSHKHALVIPAFQLNRVCREWKECPEDNIPKMPKTRHDMLFLLKKKQGYPFDPTNRGGHGSTLYSSWVTKQTQPGSMLTIPCVYSNRYEPYLAFRYCRDLPPFQEAFSGFGKNKMSMMMQMLQSGYRLDQLGGEAFLCHYPHLDSKSRMEWNESPQELQAHKINGKWHKEKPKAVKNVDWLSYKRGRVDATFVEFRKWLAREIPNERVIHKCTSNTEDDDAKLWYDRSALQ